MPSGIETVGHSVGAGVKIVVVQRFVDAHAPQDDAGMVPVTPNHAADVIDGNQLPGLITNVLPAGNFFQNEKA